MRNPTDDSFVVTEIVLKPADKDSGVTVTDVYVLDLTEIKDLAAFGIGFPPANQPKHPWVAAKGATLKPNTSYQVLFVVRIDKAGEWVFPSFDVTYEAGGHKHRATANMGLRACAPKGVKCGK